MTEKLKSLCTIEQLIDGQWLQFGEPRELTFIAPSNGLYSPDPERLQAANDFVKQEMGESFRVIKAEGQTFFVDACGPQGTQGTQGTPGKHETLIQNPV